MTVFLLFTLLCVSLLCISGGRELLVKYGWLSQGQTADQVFNQLWHFGVIMALALPALLLALVFSVLMLRRYLAAGL